MAGVGGHSGNERGKSSAEERGKDRAEGPDEILRSEISVPRTIPELLDLGEAVGTQSRGLSQERISSLPVSKYKCSFFSRKKTRGERCVICQMDYKRGDRQMTLPCKHVYHSGCVTKWLSINKACPVCFIEVSNEEPRHHSL